MIKRFLRISLCAYRKGTTHFQLIERNRQLLLAEALVKALIGAPLMRSCHRADQQAPKSHPTYQRRRKHKDDALTVLTD